MYFQARYYDPDIGRFAQADPTVPDPCKSQAYNRYVFCYGNPISYADIEGFEPTSSGPQGVTTTVAADGSMNYTPQPCVGGAPSGLTAPSSPAAPAAPSAPGTTAPGGSVNGTAPGAPSGQGSDSGGTINGVNPNSPPPEWTPPNSGSGKTAPQTLQVNAFNMDFGRDYSIAAQALFADKRYGLAVLYTIDSNCEMAYDTVAAYYAAYAISAVAAVAVETLTTNPTFMSQVNQNVRGLLSHGKAAVSECEAAFSTRAYGVTVFADAVSGALPGQPSTTAQYAGAGLNYAYCHQSPY